MEPAKDQPTHRSGVLVDASLSVKVVVSVSQWRCAGRISPRDLIRGQNEEEMG